MFPKGRRVGTELFAQTLSRGRSARSASFTIRSLAAEGPTKVSIVVPKKLTPSAVGRSALRRRYQATLEPTLSLLKPNLALIFFITKISSQQEFANEAHMIFGKMGILS